MGLNINDITNELDKLELEDQSVAVTTGGTFERKRIPIGKHPIRLVSYIELGVQDAGTYEGKQKPDEPQVRMIFEFLGKRTVETRDDGTEYAPRKSVTKKHSMHTKAGFYKLFQAMRAGDSTVTHMAQMIGARAWLVPVVWRTQDENGEYITIAKKDVKKYEKRLEDAKTDADKKNFRIFDNIEWNAVSAPVAPVLDEDGEDTGDVRPLKVRPCISDLQLFLWDNPKPMFWESIHIDGTYTKKVDGKEIEQSKNFIQEAILGAKNYEGSPIQGMLEGLDDLPGVSDDDGSEVAEKKSKKKTKDTEPVIEDEPEDELDELDELGI